jgi:hypothetical protein
MTDDYPTCEETYVTLRVYHTSADPAAVTTLLALDPTDSYATVTVDDPPRVRDAPLQPFSLASVNTFN